MTSADFRHNAHAMVDFMADFLESIEQYPVKAQVKPGDIIAQLPSSPPQHAEPFDALMHDVRNIILPGITHWQHPSFHAYFPANGSYPSVLAEMLTATLGAQCMSWETSPAATELEERVMEWLRELMGLPRTWSGVIQDTASTATLCAILSAREVATRFASNQKGLQGNPVLRVYCSTETHSSIEKAAKIAGFGKENVIKIGVDSAFAMRPDELAQAIARDKQQGFVPAIVVASIGTTSSTAIDPVAEIADICKKEGIWLHVDAAYAGTAGMLPELSPLFKGLEHADSYVFNPHKWMFTNFDCTAYFVKDKSLLLQTFEILPEYLKTAADKQVNNYRDWGIQLGRRFRALKLWFVMRSFGTIGLQEKIRGHLSLAKQFKAKLQQDGRFEILAPMPFNLICFRFNDGRSEPELDAFNAAWMQRINQTGKAYLTHTKLGGKYAIRAVLGNTNLEQRHIDQLWAVMMDTMGKF